MIRILLFTLALLLSSPLQAVEFHWQQNSSSGTLADYHGTPVILHLWASWCPPCRSEMPQLNAWKQQHPDARLIVVSLDGSPSDALLFLRRNHIRFPAWIADSQQAMRLGVRGLPATILIDGDGNIQQRMIGARDWTDAHFSKLMTAWLKPVSTAQPFSSIKKVPHL